MEIDTENLNSNNFHTIIAYVLMVHFKNNSKDQTLMKLPISFLKQGL